MVLDEIPYNTEDYIDGYIYLYTFFPYMITKKFQVYFSVDNQNYEKCKIKYIGNNNNIVYFRLYVRDYLFLKKCFTGKYLHFYIRNNYGEIYRNFSLTGFTPAYKYGAAQLTQGR